MASLQDDIRQFFSHSVLQRFERVEEAQVRFTYDEADIYLSVFAEAMEYIDKLGFTEYDQQVAAYARVFERYTTTPALSVNRAAAGLLSAALYWLGGYSANAYLLAHAVKAQASEKGQASDLLIKLLSREVIQHVGTNGQDAIVRGLQRYLIQGDETGITDAIALVDELIKAEVSRNDAEEYVAASLLRRVLLRLSHVSLWATIKGRTSAPSTAWQQYMQVQLEIERPVMDLWPSQRAAVNKGLLDGTSSIVLRMPTSAGKTKMTELAFVNDLLSVNEWKCLYIAPFRALVTEVESELGNVLPRLNLPVAALYGGSDASPIDTALFDIARVIVATPEKIKAVLNLAGKRLTDFHTVVLDEGHLIDSLTRGPAYELQLSQLRSELATSNRAIFLSALLPNSVEIASWLGKSSDALAEDTWQPTTMRIGVIVWPKGRNSTLTYITSNGQQLVDQFFVPRVMEEDIWEEVNPQTGRMRTHKFPKRGDNGTIGAALAFKYSKVGPVILYVSRPDWAESVAGKILARLLLRRELTTNLVDETNKTELASIAEYLTQVLGDASLLPAAVRHGFAFHHGQLPQGVRLVIEEEYRKQTIRLLIATNTLAQGVNLPARTIIVHSLPGSDAPVRDFWNLVGRAGRALKESEGEVIVLATGSVTRKRLQQFLDPSNVEPSTSRILKIVISILQTHGTVSRETLDALLSDDDARVTFEQAINAIDIHLLELLAEDLPTDQHLSLIDELISNLLATYQAEKLDLETGSALSDSVRQLIRLRGQTVLERVPDGSTRRRYSKAGVSLDSSILATASIDNIFSLLALNPDLNQDAFGNIIDIVSGFGELRGTDSTLIKQQGYLWMNLAGYYEIFASAPGQFPDFGASIRFVEEVLTYRTPWALNGLVRLVEGEVETRHGPTATLRDWFTLLPQLMRYGVPTKELVWVMSIGIQDRQVAIWLLNRYRQQNNGDPSSFKNFINWASESSQATLTAMSDEWPKYFSRLYARILDRHDRLKELLGEI